VLAGNAKVERIRLGTIAQVEYLGTTKPFVVVIMPIIIPMQVTAMASTIGITILMPAAIFTLYG